MNKRKIHSVVLSSLLLIVLIAAARSGSEGQSAIQNPEIFPSIREKPADDGSSKFARNLPRKLDEPIFTNGTLDGSNYEPRYWGGGSSTNIGGWLQNCEVTNGRPECERRYNYGTFIPATPSNVTAIDVWIGGFNNWGLPWAPGLKMEIYLGDPENSADPLDLIATSSSTIVDNYWPTGAVRTFSFDNPVFVHSGQPYTIRVYIPTATYGDLGASGAFIVRGNEQLTTITPGNLVVCRVGNGSGTLTSVATPTFLDEYTQGGQFVQSIAMPTVTSGPNQILTVGGTTTSECQITRSTDERFIMIAGYASAVGATTFAAPKTIGRVDSSGSVSTSTTITTGLSSIRGATSSDGVNIWLSGSTTGIVHTLIGTSSTGTVVSDTNLNNRVVNIFNGQLYVSSGTGNAETFRGVNSVGNGLPTSTGNTMTRLPGLTDATVGQSPYSFFFADVSPSVPGNDTLYIVGDSNPTAGILKFSLVSGNWVARGSVPLLNARSITGGVLNGSVVLFGTTSVGVGGGGIIYRITDSSGYNGTMNGSILPLATASANTVFRGIVFAPGAISITPTPPSGSCTASPSGVISWWRGEGNSNDAFGANNGSLLGGAGFAAGKVGLGFNLNGNAQFVSVPHSNSINPTNAITVEAWVKISQTAPTAGWSVINKDNPSSGPFDLRITNANAVGFGVFTNGWQSVYTPSNRITPGSFHHLVGTYNATNNQICVYVNGQASCGIVSGQMPVTGNSLKIGGDVFNNTFLSGSIDEVRIYNRALLPYEIQAMVSNCSGPPPPPQSPAYSDTALVPDDVNVDVTGRVPVILIHGIHGNKWSEPGHCDDCSADPNSAYFAKLIDSFKSSTPYGDAYKTYRFHYVSDKHSLLTLSSALRDRIDELIRANPSLDSKQIILVAHSMGGLVARGYMNRFNTQAGNDPRYTGKRAGEKVKKLITLATPHHGSVLSNGRARVQTSFFHPHLEWRGFLSTLDKLYWGGEGCVPCKTSLAAPNRSTLKWDDVSGIWQENSNYGASEENAELQLIGEEYTRKITAYYGQIGSNLQTTFFGSLGPIRLGAVLGAAKKLDWQDDGLNALGVIQQRIMSNEFSSIQMGSISNDGMVSVESARYDRPYNEFSGPRIEKSIFCSGFNHLRMKDGKAGARCYYPDGSNATLFQSVLTELGIASGRRAMGSVGQLAVPERLDFGNVSSGATEGERTIDLENLGVAPVTVNSLTFGGSDSSQFAIVPAPTLPFTILPDSSRSIAVRFSPTTSGDKTATLTIGSNAINPSAQIAISGIGVPSNCDLTLPQGQYFPVGGGSGNFAIPSIPCSWTASSDDDWLHVSVSGGTVNFTVDGNSSGVVRTGSIIVSVLDRPYTLTISQGTAASGCLLDVAANNLNIGPSGGPGSFPLTTPAGCSWSVSSSQTWVNGLPTGSSFGSGQVGFSVVANTSPFTRYATIQITGQQASKTFSIVQAGMTPLENCVFTWSPSFQSVPSSGGSNSVSLTTGPGCQWRLNSSDSWLTITSPNNGTGNATVTYVGTDNSANSSERIGAISVSGDGGQSTISVSQQGSQSITPDINVPIPSASLGNAIAGTSVYRNVLIQNSGMAPLTVSSIYLSAGSPEFQVVPVSNPIPPGGAAAVRVRFAPTSTGDKNATFTIRSDDPDEGEVTIDVFGSGVDANGTGPVINFPVNATNFGDASVGQIGEAVFAVQNRGNSTLNLTYSQLSGSNEFSLFRMPDSVPAGGSRNIRVRFVPTSSGAETATFRIDTNDPSTPFVTFDVEAVGIDPTNLTVGAWQVANSSPMAFDFDPISIVLGDGKGYFTRSDKKLTVIDLSTNSNQTDITFSSFPSGTPGQIAISGDKAYVSLAGLGANGQLAIVNRQTNAVSGYLPIGTDPFAVGTHNGKVYVSTKGSTPSVKVVDSVSNTVTATIPVGTDTAQSIVQIAFSSGLNRAYALYGCSTCAPDPGSIAVIDLSTNTVIDTIQIDSYLPQQMAIVGNRAFVTTEASLEIFDLESDTVAARLPLPAGTQGIAASSEFVFAASADGLNNGITVIDASTDKIVGLLDAGSARAIAFDPTTNLMYALTGAPATSFKTIRFALPSISILSSSQTVAISPGGSSGLGLALSSIDGWAGSVALSCEGLPTGSTCQFNTNPLSVPANGVVEASLVIAIPAGTIPGPYSLRVTADGASPAFGSAQRVVANVSVLVTNAPAPGVTVSGRVLTSTGRGVRGARISITNVSTMVSQSVQPDQFGRYQFVNVAPGETYTLSVTARRFQFQPITQIISGNVANLDFIASP